MMQGRRLSAAVALAAIGGALGLGAGPTAAASAFPEAGHPVLCTFSVRQAGYDVTALTGSGTCIDVLGLRTFPTTIASPPIAVPPHPTCLPAVFPLDVAMRGSTATAHYTMPLNRSDVGQPTLAIGSMGNGLSAAVGGGRCWFPTDYSATMAYVGLVPAPVIVPN